VKVKIWGARGSIPAPGPETMRYGGNTSCLEVALSDGSTLILDAGTGIRSLGLAMGTVPGPLHILLTHLHLDHVQGLMFFAPAFRRQCDITVWGPKAGDASLCERIARYISAPLAPVDVREMPFTFRQVKELEWSIGSATVRAGWVHHRGPTLGYRIDDGGTSLCYIPDHEPGIGTPLTAITDDWIPALNLARDATLVLIIQRPCAGPPYRRTAKLIHARPHRQREWLIACEFTEMLSEEEVHDLLSVCPW